MIRHTPAWRAFKRTEDCACAFASLIYLAATLRAFQTPGDPSIKLLFILAAPLTFLALSLGLPLLIAPLRRTLERYVWMSFKAGFGQSPLSVLSGLGLLALAAVFIYLQISRGALGAAGVFSGYAAGIGILFAQALLVRVLERDPQVRAVIEEGAIDLDAYFRRIGHDGPRAPDLETLCALHLAHPSAIPFESLDPLLDRPVRIDLDSLERKLVQGRRGGYCFEQNGLFLAVLTALGFKATPLAARVIWMAPPDAPRSALSHMLLKVDLPDGPFVCDVGFGGQSPTAPLRFEPGLEQATPHGTYRLIEAVGGYELQMRLPGGWAGMYRFTLDPQSAEDYETFNWRTSTHPRSRFVNNLVGARVIGDTRLNLFNDEVSIYWPDGRTQQRILSGPAEAHATLDRDFGIDVEPAEIERVWPRLPKAKAA